MDKPIAFDTTALQAQISHLALVASKSTDECVVATFIATRSEQVTALLLEKSKNFVWKGLYCDKRADSKIAVVFNFECPPGVFCLVKPWFAVIVDLEFGTVYGIQDPYQPVTVRPVSSPCGCTGTPDLEVNALRGCDAESGVSLKNVRVENGAVKGEVWTKLKVKCSGTSVIDVDEKVFDFDIDRNGGSVTKEVNIRCAHLVLKVFVTLDPSVCVHWDITGCEFKVLGRKVFEFDEHAQTCVSI